MFGITYNIVASVFFNVAIYQGAGTLASIRTENADGPCFAVSTALIECASTTPVTFHWEGEGDWKMVGDQVVTPGQTGKAWVLAPDSVTAPHVQAITAPTVSALDVERLFLRAGDVQPPAPSPAMLNTLETLLSHPDKRVRKAAVSALQPWFSGTPMDPTQIDSPIWFDDALLIKLAKDPDPGVRRRLTHILKDIRPNVSREQAHKALKILIGDPHRGVRRAAIATLKRAHQLGILPPEEAWKQAFSKLPQSGPPGRTASNTLAQLARYTEPSTVIRPDLALEVALEKHPERVWRLWGAWKQHLPFDKEKAMKLFRSTVGLSEPLIQHWAKHNPDGLHDVLNRWEPYVPHSQRWDYIAVWLFHTKHAALRSLLELDPEPPEKVKRKLRIKIDLKSWQPEKQLSD